MSSSMTSTPLPSPRSISSNHSLFKSASNSNLTTSNNNSTNSLANTSSSFSKEYYASLLYDENQNSENYYTLKSISIYTDKELITIFEKIVFSLRKTEDWQARVKVLETLQGLAKGGDATKFDNFIPLLKNCHELMELQILDLRSAVTKEACRTVAVLCQAILQSFQAAALLQQYTASSSTSSSSPSSSQVSVFYYLLELWLPKLFKQTGVKIQVIASSADKAIRLIIHSFSPSSSAVYTTANSNSNNSNLTGATVGTGYPKLFTMILEQLTTSKTAAIRKCVAEYACLACALWPLECIEKHVTVLKSIVSASVCDADSATRRAGRQLYWILKCKNNNIDGGGILSSSSSQSSLHNSNKASNTAITSPTAATRLSQLMEVYFMDQLEPAVQKHIMNEYHQQYQSSNTQNDLSVLLEVMNGSSSSSNTNTDNNSGNSRNTGGGEDELNIDDDESSYSSIATTATLDSDSNNMYKHKSLAVITTTATTGSVTSNHVSRSNSVESLSLTQRIASSSSSSSTNNSDRGIPASVVPSITRSLLSTTRPSRPSLSVTTRSGSSVIASSVTGSNGMMSSATTTLTAGATRLIKPLPLLPQQTSISTSAPTTVLADATIQANNRNIHCNINHNNSSISISSERDDDDNGCVGSTINTNNNNNTNNHSILEDDEWSDIFSMNNNNYTNNSSKNNSEKSVGGISHVLSSTADISSGLSTNSSKLSGSRGSRRMTLNGPAIRLISKASHANATISAASSSSLSIPAAAAAASATLPISTIKPSSDIGGGDGDIQIYHDDDCTVIINEISNGSSINNSVGNINSITTTAIVNKENDKKLINISNNIPIITNATDADVINTQKKKLTVITTEEKHININNNATNNNNNNNNNNIVTTRSRSNSNNAANPLTSSAISNTATRHPITATTAAIGASPRVFSIGSIDNGKNNNPFHPMDCRNIANEVMKNTSVINSATTSAVTATSTLNGSVVRVVSTASNNSNGNNSFTDIVSVLNTGSSDDRKNVAATSSSKILMSSSLSSSNQQQQQPYHSLDTLKSMCADSFWSQRVKAFENINHRLRSGNSSGGGNNIDISMTNLTMNSVTNTTATNSTNMSGINGNRGYTAITAHMMEQYIELASTHINDTHIKVATEAFLTYDLCLQYTSATVSLSDCKNLGSVIICLFQRLTDRRHMVKESANVCINKLSKMMSPLVIFTVLATKIIEIADRLKISFIQYLCGLVPFCGEYFHQPTAVYAFLNRLASMLNNSSNTSSSGVSGSSSSSHGGNSSNNHLNSMLNTINKNKNDNNSNSITNSANMNINISNTNLCISIQKLLELVYQAAVMNNTSDATNSSSSNSFVLITQIGLLPYQSQLVIKKLLQSRVPDIESLVTAAMKQDVASRMTSSAATAVSVCQPTAVPSTVVTAAAADELTMAQQSPIIKGQSPMAASNQNKQHLSLASSSPVMQAVHKATTPPYGTAVQYHNNNSPSSTATIVTTAAASVVVDMNISSILAALQFTHSHHYQPHSVDTCDEDNTLSRTMQYLKYTIKPPNHTNPSQCQQYDEFWRLNCAQIVSVLLQVFLLPPPPPPSSYSSSTSCSVQPPVTIHSQSDRSIGMSSGGMNSANAVDRSSPFSSSSSMRQFLNHRQPLHLLAAGHSHISSPITNSVTTDSLVNNKAVTGYSPLIQSHSGKGEESTKQSQQHQLRYVDYKHMTCKLLLLLVKYRNLDIQNFAELLVLRLTAATSHAPVSVTLYCEQILCELAHTSHTADILTGGSGASGVNNFTVSQKIISLLLQYLPSANIRNPSATTAIPAASNSVSAAINANPTTQLFALHVMTHAVRYLSTSQLIGATGVTSATSLTASSDTAGTSGGSLLHHILHKILPLLSCSIIDIRQSAIFLLVELYSCIGDVLWSYLTSLTQTQKTLLTIYIDRQLKQKQQLQYKY